MRRPPEVTDLEPDPSFAAIVPAHNLATDWRWQLVERIAASPAFEKSHRLRELLLYLTRHALQFPGQPLPEQEIGIAVFQRERGYDTNLDNIVRVQVSQLRKKLSAYFESPEGLAEPGVIEIPRGAYRTAFAERIDDPPVSIPVQPEIRPRRWALLAALAFSTVMFAALFAWSLWERGQLEQRFRQSSSGPSVDRLWKALFANQRPISVVMADAGLTMVNDLTGESLDLRKVLSNKSMRDRIADLIRDPYWQARVTNVSYGSYVSLTDARVANQLERLNATSGYSSELAFVRSITAHTLMRQNAILLGNRRANPWVTLFDDRLNFEYRFDDQLRKASFVNLKPKPGEDGVYHGIWNREGYCLIATRPNLTGKGNVLILSGTSMPNVEACGEIISSERWVGQISSSCASTFPYFEVLFRASVLNDTSPQYDLVSTRCGLK